jgi:hypothetical protein
MRLLKFMQQCYNEQGGIILLPEHLSHNSWCSYWTNLNNTLSLYLSVSSYFVAGSPLAHYVYSIVIMSFISKYGVVYLSCDCLLLLLLVRTLTANFTKVRRRQVIASLLVPWVIKPRRLVKKIPVIQREILPSGLRQVALSVALLGFPQSSYMEFHCYCCDGVKLGL